MLANDLTTLTPTTAFPGPALECEFPGLEVGVAEYAEGPIGCNAECCHAVTRDAVPSAVGFEPAGPIHA